eukprot:gene4282-3098_t
MAASGQFDTSALSAPCPEGYAKVCEGSTAVLFPPAMLKGGKPDADGTRTTKPEVEPSRLFVAGEDDQDSDAQAVFYNPAQVVNRDLSICAIELFSRQRRSEPKRKGGTTEGITILEALSATGLRAIRYFKEITNVQLVIANDMDPDAVRCIAKNCAFNGVPEGRVTMTSNLDLRERGSEKEGDSAVLGAVIPNLDDAVDLMHRLAINSGVHANSRIAMVQSKDGVVSYEPLLQQELMDVVDLDPYGSASPFLEGAFRCIKEGGLMLVTSTDSAVLCGNYMDTCHAKYNSVSYKGAHCHEMAVRILLATIERVANKHRKYIVPVISLHIDFYVRCFFRVYTQPAETKLSCAKLGYQLQCTHCPAFWVRPMAVERPSRGKAGKKRGREAQPSTAGVPAPPEASETLTPPPQETFPQPPSRASNPRMVCPPMSSLACAMGQSTNTSGMHCPVCGSCVTLSGPLYCGPTQNRPFLTELLNVIEERDAEKKLTATARIKGLVLTAMEELPECPLFYHLADIASYVKVRCPQTPFFVGALGRLGYRCSQVHCDPAGFKADCPPDILFSVMLRWKALQDQSDQGGSATPASLSDVKLRIAPLAEADFAYDKKYDFRRDGTGIAKFIPNAPGWGPKRRHTGAAVDDSECVQENIQRKYATNSPYNTPKPIVYVYPSSVFLRPLHPSHLVSVVLITSCSFINGTVPIIDQIMALRRSLLGRNLFDACFLLNLDRRTDRLSHAKRQIERARLHKCLKPNISVERISGQDGSRLDVGALATTGLITADGLRRFRLPLEEKLFGMDLTLGAIGCAMSHRMAWQRVVDGGCSAALILEDDVEFHPRFARDLQKRWANVPADWGIVYLGGLDLLASGKPPRPFVADGVRRAYQGQRELTAYVVNARSAQRCLELTSSLTWQVDTHICSLLAEDKEAQDRYIADPVSYVLQPSLVIQITSLGTDVQKKPSDNPALEDAARRMREFIGGGTSVR